MSLTEAWVLLCCPRQLWGYNTLWLFSKRSVEPWDQMVSSQAQLRSNYIESAVQTGTPPLIGPLVIDTLA